MNNEKELPNDKRRKLINALIQISRNFLHTTNNISEDASAQLLNLIPKIQFLEN